MNYINCTFCTPDTHCSICNDTKQLKYHPIDYFHNANFFPQIAEYFEKNKDNIYFALNDKREELKKFLGNNPDKIEDNLKKYNSNPVRLNEKVKFLRAETSDDYSGVISENWMGVPSSNLIFKSIENNNTDLYLVPMTEFNEFLKKV